MARNIQVLVRAFKSIFRLKIENKNVESLNFISEIKPNLQKSIQCRPQWIQENESQNNFKELYLRNINYDQSAEKTKFSSVLNKKDSQNNFSGGYF